MRNPIQNMITLVPTNKLVTCKRCTCPELAWVESKKTGKWYLVHTSGTRPCYRGENQAPEAPNGYRYAVKTAAHSCDEWTRRQTEHKYRWQLDRALGEIKEIDSKMVRALLEASKANGGTIPQAVTDKWEPICQDTNPARAELEACIALLEKRQPLSDDRALAAVVAAYTCINKHA